MADVSGITRRPGQGFLLARGTSQGCLPAWLAGSKGMGVEWHDGQPRDGASKTSQLKKLAAPAVGERNFSTAT